MYFYFISVSIISIDAKSKNIIFILTDDQDVEIGGEVLCNEIP